MKILIDNGHGRATAGKRSPVWPDGKQLFEYEFNRDIARRMHEALTARGTDSVPVVPEIDDIPLAERTRRVNEIAAQVGQIIFSTPLGALHDSIGYQSTFLVISGIVCVASLYAFVILKKDDQQVDGQPL